MIKETRLIYVVAGMLLAILLFVMAIDSIAQQKYVDDFYGDAYNRGRVLEHKNFEFSITPIEGANGRSTLKDGGYWLIEIDSEFFTYYHAKSQLKRLVYHELAHILLDKDDTKDGNTIMNPDPIYRPLEEEMINDLFR